MEGKSEKLTFENLGDFYKKRDDEGSGLLRVGMNGNSHSVWDICRQKVKIPPSETIVVCSISKHGYGTVNSGSALLKRSSVAVLVTVYKYIERLPTPATSVVHFMQIHVNYMCPQSGSSNYHPSHLSFASLHYIH